MGFWRFGLRRKANECRGGVANDVWCAARPGGGRAKVASPLAGGLGSAGRGEAPKGEPRLSDRFGAAPAAACARGAGKGGGGACGGKTDTGPGREIYRTSLTRAAATLGLPLGADRGDRYRTQYSRYPRRRRLRRGGARAAGGGGGGGRAAWVW